MNHSSARSVLVHFALLLAGLIGFSAPAAAQLDLPERPRKATKGDTPRRPGRERPEVKGELVPHLTCTVCYERNYTTRINFDAENGRQLAWCGVCRTQRLHRIPAQGATGGELLDLPDVPRGSAPRAEAIESLPKVTGVAALEGAAALIFQEVGRVKDVDATLAVIAVDRLLELGEPGTLAARAALFDEHAPTMITGVRVLLRSDRPEDADRVVQRMRTRMPAKAAAAIVDELAKADPVRANPRFLAELLTHPQTPVRMSAERLLLERADARILPMLLDALRAKKSDARLRAVNVLSKIDDPAVLELLLERLEDSNAKVAWAALSTLASSTDERVETELLKNSFRERWIFRPGAYAILALVEREDRLFRAILNETHVASLLRGMEAQDSFIAGACATALAGIGFRSEDPGTTPWLDHEVAERLVATTTGEFFFNDHSSLHKPALRRLKLIAGVSLGSAGPEWAGWWETEREDFRAARATLVVPEGSEGELVVRFRTGGDDAGAYVLVGPDSAIELASGSGGESAARGEGFYLTANEARDFVGLLRREEVLGSSRMPGRRGSEALGGRSLDIEVAGQGKSFVFGPDVAEPWFERTIAMARSLVERNEWQRYPHPVRHEGDRHRLWSEAGDWWGAEHTELERAIGLKALLLGRLESLTPSQRDSGLERLQRIYHNSATRDRADFGVLVKLLSEEAFFGKRARLITELARSASGIDRERSPHSAEAVAKLIDTLHESFEEDAGLEMAALLDVLGEDHMVTAASDERPLIRAVVASLLAERGTATSEAALLELMRDPLPEVEAAAVLAAGQAGVEAAREELIRRARRSEPAIRESALRALGYLGGERALPALLTGLSDTDPGIKVAAAESVARLGDPATAPLLVSLLRQGRTSPTYEAVRTGLIRLGEHAWDDLLAAMRSPLPEARRESALLLAYQSVPQAASILMSILTDDPTDKQVANELVILTCIDMKDEADPANGWWAWWDGVRHDDAMSWFRAAMEARGVPAPAPEAFAAGGTREAIEFLVAVMAREENHLAERARRQLERLAGRELGLAPPRGPERDAWLTTLSEALLATRD